MFRELFEGKKARIAAGILGGGALLTGLPLRAIGKESQKQIDNPEIQKQVFKNVEIQHGPDWEEKIGIDKETVLANAKKGLKSLEYLGTGAATAGGATLAALTGAAIYNKLKNKNRQNLNN